MGSYGNHVTKEYEPLLADKMQYPNCPGCKCAYLSAKGAGPPVKQLLMISFLVFCSALPITSLLSFLYFMIDDFHIAKRTEDIGYYAGAMVSAYMCGRVFTSVPWAMFADKYGRRPVFFIGLVSIIVLQPIFGISTNYWVAMVARILLGIFNGMLGPITAYAAEICSPESQAWGLNVIGTSWSFGLIVGPAIGGFFARPVSNFPGIFSENSIFASYPYLLPPLTQAGFAAIALAIVHYLPETVHNHDDEKRLDIEKPLAESINAEKPSLWLNWPLMASVTVYCVWSLHDISFTEIFSMWLVSPEKTGGLALQTSDVGTILSTSGFGMLCVQLVFFPPLAKILGPIWVTRTTALVAVPLVLLFPFMPYLHGQAQWLSLNALALLRSSCSTMVITGTYLLVNNAVDSDQRGAANGISVSCVSAFRAIGPAAGGALFAWCQSRHDATFLPGSKLLFVTLDLTCVLAIFTMSPLFLPNKLNEPYSEMNFQDSYQNNDKKRMQILE